MMARDIKGWEIENPAWRDYSKTICTKDHFWRGIYGSGFYLGKGIERVMFDYPNIADHFYYLWYNEYRLDIIFASYKIDEIKNEIEDIKRNEPYSLKYLIEDENAAQKKKDEITKETEEYKKYHKELGEIIVKMIASGGLHFYVE